MSDWESLPAGLSLNALIEHPGMNKFMRGGAHPGRCAA